MLMDLPPANIRANVCQRVVGQQAVDSTNLTSDYPFKEQAAYRQIVPVKKELGLRECLFYFELFFHAKLATTNNHWNDS